jgi:two-component system cell cycle sensor histidine kinase/response regulator CckA
LPWLHLIMAVRYLIWRIKCLMSEVPHVQPQRGVVLLVDDEAAIRRLARIVLESAGFVVLDAGNGRDGLALCAAHPGPIDLLLSDVTMPELGGRELAEGAVKLRPGLKVVFMSGHHDDDVLHASVQAGAAFLQKPFTSHDLETTVSATLSA